LELLEPSPELEELFERWGLRTLGDLARLPEHSLAQRLDDKGMELYYHACGKDGTPLHPFIPAETFEACYAFDWPLENSESLAFILNHLLDRLCGKLASKSLRAEAIDLSLELADRTKNERLLRFGFPLNDPATILSLLRLDLATRPPQAAIVSLQIRLYPTPPRPMQFSLIDPPLPAPEKLARTLARLAALVGEQNVGSPALLNTHRPDAFRMRPFQPHVAGRRPQIESRRSKVEGRRSKVEGRVSSSGGRVSGSGFQDSLSFKDPSSTRNSKLETRNPEFGISNSELETQDLELETRNLEPETRDPKLRVPSCEHLLASGNLAAKVQNTQLHQLEIQNSELGTQNPELETRNSKPETYNLRLATCDLRLTHDLRPAIALSLRIFRPPLPAQVVTEQSQPVAIRTSKIRGRVLECGGPWHSSGDWWEDKRRWAKEEWDMLLSNGGVYRIYRDLNNERWFIYGTYD
jgi:nucleotidyltransferase/DNA polymerase involved in DNA repair